MKIPAPETPSVGIREFRATLAEYIDAGTPVTVTRHGQAVGLFVPLRRPSAEALQRLRAATAKVQEVMPLSDQDIDEMVADFDALRHGRPLPRAGA
jgi:antitoxin (DNA-binding transcriptional repressor) of toxin-antitoxin stability system